MKVKNYILLLAFIILTIFAGWFIPYFRGKTFLKVKAYAEGLVICENTFDENECFRTEKCEGIYGPSCPDCQNLEFRRCQEVPEKVKKDLIREKDLCLKTSGQWQKTKYGSFCICPISGGVRETFSRIKGCVSD